MNVTPYSLYQTYRYLDVPLVDGTKIYGLDIHEYRNNASKKDGGFSTKSGNEAYDALVAVLKTKCKSLGTFKLRFVHADTEPVNASWRRTVFRADTIVTWPDLIRPFIGKGSPDEIRMALRLAVHFGLLAPTRGAMQRYCDDNIGLDCSGFAQSYYGLSNWKSIEDARDFRQKIVKLEDVRPGDALIWLSGDHVAVIDSIVSADREAGITYCLTCKVAESTGDRLDKNGPEDGLNYSEYLLLFDGHDKIKVMRHLASERDSYMTPNACVRRLT